MGQSDPCAGHACDHCWICTHLGVCCSQVPNIKALLSADHFDLPKDRTAEFLEAIQADSQRLTMAELVRLDIEVRAGLRHQAIESGQHDCDHPHADLELAEADILEEKDSAFALSVSLSVPALPPAPADPLLDLFWKGDAEAVSTERGSDEAR